MRVIWTFISLIFVNCLFAQTTYAVRGSVMRTQAHCGGARLTEEDMRRFGPFPERHKNLYIRLSDSNRVSSPIYSQVETDDSGRFCIALPPGTYSFVDAQKKDSSYIKTILKVYSKSSKYHGAADKDCLAKWLSTPDAVVIVKDSDVSDLTIQYYDRCPWNITCVQYSGPMPP